MKHVFSGLIALFASLSLLPDGRCQNNHSLDSLHKQLAVAETDSAKGHIYLALASASGNDFESYERYATKAIQLCKNGEYRFGEAKGRLFFGYALVTRGELDSSFEQYNTAASIFEDIMDSLNLANTYIQIAGNYNYLGDVEKAIQYFERAIEIYKSKKDASGLSDGYSMLCTCYGRLGDYDKALKYNLMGLEYAEQTNSREQIAMAYNSLSNIYGFTKKYDLSIKYELKALKIWEDLGVTFRQSNCLENLGAHYLNIDQPGKALSYLEKSLSLIESNNNPEDISGVYSKLGQAYRALGEFDKAYSYLKQAEQLYEKIGFLELLSDLNFELGLTQLKRKEYNSALEYLDKSESAALKTNDLFTLSQVYQAKSEIYQIKKKYKLALEYKLKQGEVKDSILNLKTEEAMAEMREKYQSQKKDLEINMLKSDAELKAQKTQRQKIVYWSTTGLFVLLAIIGFSLIRQYRLKQRLKLERFRNKIASNLHDDVGSTLSSIAMYSEVIRKKVKDKLPETLPMLENMSSSSKSLMDAMSDIVWTVNPKNNSIHNLLSRVKAFGSELCDAKGIEFSYEEQNLEDIKLEMTPSQNAYLVIKEAINNALKYSACTKIKLSASVVDEVFRFAVSDNGNGFDPSKVETGNGLRTMKERMTEVEGLLEIVSNENGTSVEGTMPV